MCRGVGEESNTGRMPRPTLPEAPTIAIRIRAIIAKQL